MKDTKEVGVVAEEEEVWEEGHATPRRGPNYRHRHTDDGPVAFEKTDDVRQGVVVSRCQRREETLREGTMEEVEAVAEEEEVREEGEGLARRTGANQRRR